MSENYLPVVVGVAVVGGHVLRLLSSDGTAGDVDFSAERWTGVLAPLNDPGFFAEVRVDQEAGTIMWPGGMDLAPEPLSCMSREVADAAGAAGGRRRGDHLVQGHRVHGSGTRGGER